MGFFDKIRQGLEKTKEKFSNNVNKVFANFRKVDEELMEELEENLVLSDISYITVNEIMKTLRENIKIQNLQDSDQVKIELKNILKNILLENAVEENVLENSLKVILVIGINGVGKTTTIGKLANNYINEGKKVVIAAADTFRAAAIEQLEIWTKRAGAQLIKGKEHEDPSSVVYSAVKYAKENADILLIDTAGRLQNKKNLMEELSKIHRVIDKAMENTKYVRENYIVIDGTTGQNGILQVKAFDEIAKSTGVIVTKLDGTAKGGIIFSIVQETKIPIKYIGIGEKIDDLQKFNENEFVEAIF